VSNVMHMSFNALPLRSCQKCKRDIPTFIIIKGFKRYNRRRKYCFKCNPFNTLSGSTIEGKKKRDVTERVCRKCNEPFPIAEFHTTNLKRGYKNSYCKKCQNTRVRNSRQRFKDDCIAYKGGRCEICKYSKCNAALEFHHIGKKEFQLSRYPGCKLDQRVKRELDGCKLLCSNCHRETHSKGDTHE
jgi:hypothetical protein